MIDEEKLERMRREAALQEPIRKRTAAKGPVRRAWLRLQALALALLQQQARSDAGGFGPLV